MKEHKQMILTTIFIVLLGIIALVALGYTFILTFKNINFGRVEALSPDREVKILPVKYNYNFAIPQNDNGKKDVNGNNNEKEEKTESKHIEYRKINYNFPIPQYNLSEIKSLEFPRLDYKISINDNITIYEKSNRPLNGEIIFTCHSLQCQNLNELKINDHIYMNFRNAPELSYKIVSISIHSKEDKTVYAVSKDRFMKIIIPVSGSKNRVIIAKIIN